MKQKIIICGGHVTPAIALIDELQKGPTYDVVFAGRKVGFEGRHESSAEFELIRQKGIRFLPVTTGRLQRTFTVQTIPSLLKVPIGFVQAIYYCLRERPLLVVSFGGYVALPMALGAWLLRIPVVTHEQTLGSGLTNRIIARIAKRVCVTFEESLPHFPSGKTVRTGLPIRKDIFVSPKKPAYAIDEKKYPLIYITGGSQGAKSLNDRLFPSIGHLLKTHTIIQQTGILSFAQASQLHSSLAPDARTRYIPEAHITGSNLSWILHHAWVVVGRSGANTTVELAALGKIAVLVPLPWSAANEQLLHAQWLARYGGAIVLPQDTLSKDTLDAALGRINKSYDEFQTRAARFSTHIPRDGAARLAAIIRDEISIHP